MALSHEVTVIVEGQQVSDWQSGNIDSSVLTPTDSFVLRIPYSLRLWNTIRRDARVTIRADGTPLLDGFVDKRIKRGKARVLEVHGRDRTSRVCDESAPQINYNGMTILAAARDLLSPWFAPDKILIDNSVNRRLRRGKGKRVAAGTEPVVNINLRVPRRGQVHPGETRWQVMHEILSRSGLIGFSSADGKSFFIGKANQTQAPQYEFRLGAPEGRITTNVRDLTIEEDDGDRFSLYLCAGVGGQSDTNYGKNVIDNRGVAFDNPFNRKDGTGRDFIHPKRMFLPERAFSSYHDADRVAALEKARRDYKRHIATVESEGFGQDLGVGIPTLFTYDTVSRIIDEEAEVDDTYYMVSCSYSFDRDNGETTVMHLVPTGTEIVI